jgi:DNA-binding NtrC family response regulator
MNTFWVIEILEDNGNLKAYLSDVITDNDYAVVMTKNIHKAIQFTREGDGQMILDDSAFRHAFAGRLDQFKVREHAWMG